MKRRKKKRILVVSLKDNKMGLSVVCIKTYILCVHILHMYVVHVHISMVRKTGENNENEKTRNTKKDS